MNKIQQAQMVKEIILGERNRCASLARAFYDRASKDGMLAAMHAASEIEELIRNQPI
jgi:truncated hemoglobin YjbI